MKLRDAEAVDLNNLFDISALSKELGWTKASLAILSRDPFSADKPARKRDAEWIAPLWRRFNVQPGAHLRRVHYILVSQVAGSVLMPKGLPYENKEKPFILLNASSLDARYLHLIPPPTLSTGATIRRSSIYQTTAAMQK
jgi:hypothetical protein